MFGAITGGIAGSVFEGKNIKTTDFNLINPGSRFTDDTVLTVAVADALLRETSFFEAVREWARKYPNAGYGGSFQKWIFSSKPEPYNSWGNGSAMRVSPVAWTFQSVEKVLKKAEESAVITHNHPEGIKGAQAIAAAVFLARTQKNKKLIRSFIKFDYDLDRSIEDIRPSYQFDISCQGSVPEAIISFLESTDCESAIRLAVSLGGDSDTIACMAGSIAEAYYNEIPNELLHYAREILPGEMLEVVEEFRGRYQLL